MSLINLLFFEINFSDQHIIMKFISFALNHVTGILPKLLSVAEEEENFFSEITVPEH